MWNQDSPVSVVSLHWWPRRDWSSTGLRSQQLSLGPRADNVTIPLDLTQLSCPGFTLAAGLPSSFTTDGVGCWGGGEPCWEPAISLDSHHVSLVQWTNLFASRHKGYRFKSPGGYLNETGILLLALSATLLEIYIVIVFAMLMFEKGNSYHMTGRTRRKKGFLCYLNVMD